MNSPVKDAGRLKVSTPSDRELAMTRVFDAPRSMVFDAWTKPELRAGGRPARLRSECGGCDRRHPFEPWSDVVPNCVSAYGLALRLARRNFIPRNAGDLT